MRMPRSAAPARSAICSAVVCRSPMAVKTSRSMAAFMAAECWEAKKGWKRGAGLGMPAADGEAPVAPACGFPTTSGAVGWLIGNPPVEIENVLLPADECLGDSDLYHHEDTKTPGKCRLLPL